MCETAFELLKSYYENYLNSLNFVKKHKLTIHIMGSNSELCINASICKSGDKQYEIKISKYLFEVVINLVRSSFEHLNDDTFVKYHCDYKYSLPHFIDGGDERTTFYNRVCHTITIMLFCHELGHILLGHIDNNKEWNELDDNNERLGYEYQCCEMFSDWFGLGKSLYNSLDLSGLLDNNINVKEYRFFKMLKNELTITFLSATLLYSSFANMNLKASIDNNDMENRSHPHPYVRLFYSHFCLYAKLIELICCNWVIDVDYKIFSNLTHIILLNSVADVTKMMSNQIKENLLALVTDERYKTTANLVLEKENEMLRMYEPIDRAALSHIERFI